MATKFNPVTSKLPKTGDSIFTTMSSLAREHNAINLSQGFPDFTCSDELVSLVQKYMAQGHNQYAPMAGVRELRDSIASKTQDLYGAIYDPEKEITITAGATQAIYTAIAATIRDGDEVIIFGPSYDCYSPAVELNGGRPVYVELKHPDYSIDWNGLQKVVNHSTRMIIINSPHNPTGTTLSKSDMQKLEKLTRNTDILVLSDEVYEHIIFDGTEHQSASQYPELAKRSFIISSFGKTYHTTGWKMGYCLAPSYLMAEFRKVHQFIVFAVNTPIQYALAEYLKKKEDYLGLGQFYQEKRDYFLKLLKGSDFTTVPSSGTYFQLLNYSKISQEKDTAFAIKLTKENKIASIPISVFYSNHADNKELRFCFAKGNETLEKAAEILCSIKP